MAVCQFGSIPTFDSDASLIVLDENVTLFHKTFIRIKTKDKHLTTSKRVL